MDSSPRPTHLADLVAAAAPAIPTTRRSSTPPTGATLTWAELDAAVRRRRGGCTAAGLTAGDRVVIRCASGPPCAVAVLGALRAGAVAVPVRPATSPQSSPTARRGWS